MNPSVRLAEFLFEGVGRIGADPTDSDELRLRKALLVVVAVLVLPVAFVWGVLYRGLGAPAGLFAFAYVLVSAAAIVIFSRRRDVKTFLRVELVDILLAARFRTR